MWEDISKLTKEELERESITAPLDSEDHVQLTPDYWTEVNGVRFLKRPLKVDKLKWYLYTIDCASVIAGIFDEDFLYVFAFSTSKEITEQMGIYYDENSLWEKGYDYVSGFSSEEAHSID